MLQSRTAGTPNESIQWWRIWATNHRVLAAVVAGVVATHVATIFGYWFPGIGLTRLDWNTANGWVYVPFGSPLAKFVTGGVFHYLDGIVFAVVFACALHPGWTAGRARSAWLLCACREFTRGGAPGRVCGE
jgi:hypothetical protein